MRKIALTLLLLAVAIGGWTWWSSDERRIARKVQEIADLVDKGPGETQLAGLDRARRIVVFFAEPFEFRADSLHFRTRDRNELARGIHAYRAGADRGSMVVSDREINVVDDRATLHLTTRFAGGVQPFGRPNDAYRFQVNWLERDGEWKIDYVELLEVFTVGPGR